MPPVAPMLAKLARELPVGGGLAYEPKWDGFRTVVFRDGPEVVLGSRNERPLTRYFPELADPLRATLPARCVVDGEIVIAGPAGLDFEALLQRIHPAESRVRLLARATPSSFVAFDLLALGDLDLRPRPFRERRAALAEALGRVGAPVHLTPMTEDPALAASWFEAFEGAGLDGVVVKDLDQPYQAGRRAMVKVKHERTADCVVAGFRWHRAGPGVGSLLLGLYDGDGTPAGAGTLHHVGVTASFSARRRVELVDELAPYRVADPAGHPWAGDGPPTVPEAAPGRRPGGPSRWSAGRDQSFELLRPELVCEVAYDHLQGDRFRHATTFRAWRPDRRPESCRYDQLEVAVPTELVAVLNA